jgi:F0F1-type ATP synthase delta subunit
MSLESSIGREFLNIMDALRGQLVADIVASSTPLELTSEQLSGLQATVATTLESSTQRGVDTLTKIVNRSSK